MNPYIIAEIASAHFGNIAVLHDLIFAAYDAGCDGVKIQVWREIEIRNHKAYRNLKKFELTVEQWQQAARTIKSLKMDLWVEIYSHYSYELAIKLNYDYCKASTKIANNDLRFLKLYNDFVSDSVVRINNIFWKSESISSKLVLKKHKKITVGEQLYPTTLEQGKKEINFINDNSCDGREIVYCCHQNPITDGAYTLPMAALQSGAKYIEKHLCIKRDILEKYSNDWVSAFEPDELKHFVKLIKSEKKVSYIK